MSEFVVTHFGDAPQENRNATCALAGHSSLNVHSVFELPDVNNVTVRNLFPEASGTDSTNSTEDHHHTLLSSDDVFNHPSCSTSAFKHIFDRILTPEEIAEYVSSSNGTHNVASRTGEQDISRECPMLSELRKNLSDPTTLPEWSPAEMCRKGGNVNGHPMDPPSWSSTTTDKFSWGQIQPSVNEEEEDVIITAFRPVRENPDHENRTAAVQPTITERHRKPFYDQSPQENKSNFGGENKGNIQMKGDEVRGIPNVLDLLHQAQQRLKTPKSSLDQKANPDNVNPSGICVPLNGFFKENPLALSSSTTTPLSSAQSNFTSIPGNRNHHRNDRRSRGTYRALGEELAGALGCPSTFVTFLEMERCQKLFHSDPGVLKDEENLLNKSCSNRKDRVFMGGLRHEMSTHEVALVVSHFSHSHVESDRVNLLRKGDRSSGCAIVQLPSSNAAEHFIHLSRKLFCEEEGIRFIEDVAKMQEYAWKLSSEVKGPRHALIIEPSRSRSQNQNYNNNSASSAGHNAHARCTFENSGQSSLKSFPNAHAENRTSLNQASPLFLGSSPMTLATPNIAQFISQPLAMMNHPLTSMPVITNLEGPTMLLTRMSLAQGMKPTWLPATVQAASAANLTQSVTTPSGLSLPNTNQSNLNTQLQFCNVLRNSTTSGMLLPNEEMTSAHSNLDGPSVQQVSHRTVMNWNTPGFDIGHLQSESSTNSLADDADAYSGKKSEMLSSNGEGNQQMITDQGSAPLSKRIEAKKFSESQTIHDDEESSQGAIENVITVQVGSPQTIRVSTDASLRTSANPQISVNKNEVLPNGGMMTGLQSPYILSGFTAPHYTEASLPVHTSQHVQQQLAQVIALQSLNALSQQTGSGWMGGFTTNAGLNVPSGVPYLSTSTAGLNIPFPWSGQNIVPATLLAQHLGQQPFVSLPNHPNAIATPLPGSAISMGSAVIPPTAGVNSKLE